jgi:hypothetical protein
MHQQGGPRLLQREGVLHCQFSAFSFPCSVFSVFILNTEN